MKNCLDSIAFQIYHPQMYEVIVVDNNSRDNTKELVEEYEGKLDGEGDQDGDHRNQAREINLAKKVNILNDGVEGFLQEVRKISPDDYASYVEEEKRKIVGGQLRYAPKNNRKGEIGEDRLDQVPEWTEDGLLID